jgi:beta-lactamase class A
MQDDVDVSLRDLAFWMMSISDNTATDVIMEMLGGASVVNATMKQLGLVETELTGDCLALLDDLGASLGLTEGADGWQHLDDDVLRACVALQPAGSSRSTPRQMTSLLSMIWRDEAAAPDDCAVIRRIMGLQVWPHRLTSGFPDGFAISAKTGTLPGIRNEAGVVESAEGDRYAVAVFTRSHSFNYRQPAVDAAIGNAAHLAIRSFNAV